MGRWSWVRISRPPWKRFLKKSELSHVKNLINHPTWVPRDYEELRRGHVRPHTKTKNSAVQRGGECYKAYSLGRRLVNLLPVAQRTNASAIDSSSMMGTHQLHLAWFTCNCCTESYTPPTVDLTPIPHLLLYMSIPELLLILDSMWYTTHWNRYKRTEVVRHNNQPNIYIDTTNRQQYTQFF